jgi:hypothetical protein
VDGVQAVGRRRRVEVEFADPGDVVLLIEEDD